MSIFILTPPKTSHVLRNKHTNLTGMKTGDLLCSSYYREGLDLGPGIGNGDKEDLKLKKKKKEEKTNVKLMVLLSDITESKQFFSKRYDE